MGEFVLALDVGTTSLTTVVASDAAHDDLQVLPLAVGRERSAIPVLAFITDDGDAIFGAEAAERGSDRPERLVLEFTRSIGDAVPVVVGGFAVSGEDLFARMVLWIVTAAAADRGIRPAAVAIAHPTSWCGHRAEAVRGRLREFGLEDVILLPSAVVVTQQYASATSRSHTVGVYDLGGSSCEATLLRGGRVLGESRMVEVGGAEVDAALLKHVRDLLARDSGAADTHAEMLATQRAVVSAKETLSFSSDAAVPVTVGGRESTLRVTRSELETVATGVIARSLDALEQALEIEHLDPGELDEIILIGGSARIPLVTEVLSAQFDRPLTVPDDPTFAAAVGVARVAWSRMRSETAATRDAAALVSAADDAAAPSPGVTEGALARMRRIRIPIPYGAAVTLAAGAAIIAAGMVFAGTTPLGSGSDAAAGAGEGVSTDRGPLSLLRSASEYSVDVPSGSSPQRLGAGGKADAGDAEAPSTKPATPHGGGPTLEPPDAGVDGDSAVDPVTKTATDQPRTGASASPQPSPSPQTTQEPTSEPTTEPTSEPTTEPTSEPTTEPTPEPTAELEPAPEPEPTSEPASDPAPSPELPSDPAPTPETGSELTPTETPGTDTGTAPEPPSSGPTPETSVI
ncbi:Hsp70 family protein [Microbacterium sp. NPDC089318]